MNIKGALAAGYTAEQILKYFSKAFPDAGERIQEAVALGKPIEEVLKYLSKMQKGDVQRMQRMQGPSESNPYLRAKKSQSEYAGKQVSNIVQSAATIGGTALGAYGLARGLPALARSGIGQNVLSKFKFGQKTPTSIPSTGNISQSPITQGMQPTPLQQTNPVATSIGQANVSNVPSVTPKFNSSSIIQEMGLEPKIDNLLNAGNPPEAIGEVLNQSLNPAQKKWLDTKIKEGSAAPLQDMVRDFIQNRPKNQPIVQPIEQEKQEYKLDKTAYDISAETKSPGATTKGSLAFGPNDVVGEIKAIRNGKALIEDNGKLHKVDIDDLIQSPLPEKDLADLHDDLIKGIEKETGEDVSRSVNFAGYDPSTNTLAFLPHDGSLYIYDDISEEEKRELTNILSTRKTTGENYIGAWKAESKSPIGAAMSRLIKKLQSERGGKGKEYSGKFQTVYSAFEPAIKAAKLKKKKKK
jgi:hypothetical protein